MSDLSPDTNKLLELARAAPQLSDARRMQIKAGLLAQIAAGGSAAGVASHAAWGKAAFLSGSLGKGLSVVVLLSALGAGAYLLGVRPLARAPQPGAERAAARSTVLAANATPKTPPSELSAPAGAVGAPTADEQSAPSDPAPVAARSPAAASGAGSPKSPASSAGHTAPASEPSRASPAAASSADTLADETRLLRDADQALRAGNAQGAMALLDEHAARYPHGVLAPERSAERMIARCKLGQADANAAQAYLAAHPNSAFAARIQDACGATR